MTGQSAFLFTKLFVNDMIATKGVFPPEVIEAEVGELFPKSDWIRLNHRVIWHGRRRCHARRPACGACSVASYCPSFGEGPTDPKVAAKLVREPRG